MRIETIVAAIAALTLGTGLLSTVVRAEDKPAPTIDLEEIVVTATRESSLLSKTPISMTAITGEGLRDSGVTDARSLENIVPNLAITENGDGSRISIRGVTSTDGTEKGDPSAAFLLDGIYLARPQDLAGSFYDVARIEVLRGPQGTLYGRNTTAGVINVISNAPSNEFAASVDTQFGNLNSVKTTGMVNLPVNDMIALRAAVNYDRQDNNVLKGPDSPYSLRNRDVLSERLSASIKFNESIDLVVRADHSHSGGASTNAVPLSNFFPGALTPTVDPTYVNNGSTAQRTLPYGEVYPDRKSYRFSGIQAELTADLGHSSKLTYLGSYRGATLDSAADDFLFAALQNPAVFHDAYHQVSQELRLAFGTGRPLHGQVGAYYFREQSFLNLDLGPPLASLVGGPTAVGFVFPQGPTIARSIAGFGQLTYDITSDLHFSVGARYTQDNKSRDGATALDLQDPASGAVSRVIVNQNIASRKFTKTTWRVGIDYDASDLGLIYGSISTGYKAGGFNDGCVTGAGIGCSLNASQLYYDPETLTAYEMGVKFKFFDSRLRLNGAIFHYNYDNLQLSQACCNPPQTLTRNAAAAKVDGLELDAVVNATDADRVELGADFLYARYGDFFPDTVNFPTFNFAGKLLDHAPRFVGAVGYSHDFRLAGGGEVTAGVRSRFSTQYYMQDLNNLSQFRQPSFHKTDVTLTYQAANGHWYVQGYGKNLEDKITLAAASSGLLATATPEEPRTYGVRFGVKY